MASGVGACVDVLHADTLLLVRGGGTTALTCFWNDGHTLMANLNTRTAFQPGMSVRMRDGVLAPHGHSCPGSDSCAIGLVRALSTTSPCGALACPVPTALLVGPTAISNCPNATIVLDSSASTPAGIVLPTYEWSVVAVNTTNAAAIAAVLAVLPATQSIVTIASALLANGSGGLERYVFNLRVRSFLGFASEQARLEVVRSGRGPSPIVTIEGPLQRSVRSSEALALASYATIASCWADTVAIDFSWAVSSYTSLLSSTSRLTLPAGALYAGRSYAITVRAAMRGTPTAYAEASVAVFVRYEALIARIGGGDRRVQLSVPLALDASASVDPSTLPPGTVVALGFAWSVSRIVSSSSAAAVELEAVALPAGQGGAALLTLPAAWLSAGVYLVSVAVSSADGRGASMSVKLTAVATPVPRVTLEPLPNGKPSADERLVLRALSVTIDDSAAAAAALVAAGLAKSVADVIARGLSASLLPWQYVWTAYELDQSNSATAVYVRQLNLFDPLVSSTGPDRANFVLLPGAMVPGAAYAFELSVSAPFAGVGAEVVRLCVPLNRPPYGGDVVYAPTSGVSMSTVFTLTADGWTDDDADDLPLRYSFESRSEQTELLGELRLTASLDAFLPAGIWDFSVRVADQYSAATLAEAVGRCTVASLALDEPKLASVIERISLAAAVGESDTVHQLVRSLSAELTVAVDRPCAVNTSATPNATDANATSAFGCGLTIELAQGARERMLEQLEAAQEGDVPTLDSLRIWSESVAAVLDMPGQLDKVAQLLGAEYVKRLASSTLSTGIDASSSLHLTRSFTTVLSDKGEQLDDEARAERDKLISDAARALSSGMLVGSVVGEAPLLVESATVSVSAQRSASTDLEDAVLDAPGRSAGSVQLGRAAAAVGGTGGLEVRIVVFNHDIHFSEAALVAAAAALAAGNSVVLVDGNVTNTTSATSTSLSGSVATSTVSIDLALVDADGLTSSAVNVSGLATPVLIALPYALPSSTVGPAGASGTCIEYGGCSGRGTCVRGGCLCAAPWLGDGCTLRAECSFWDEVDLAWATDGCTTVYSAAEAVAAGISQSAAAAASLGNGTVGCACRHLTDFAAIYLPTSAEELAAEVGGVTFNTVGTEDFAALASPEITDNPWIYGLIFGLLGGDLLFLFIAFVFDRRGRRHALHKATIAPESPEAVLASDKLSAGKSKQSKFARGAARTVPRSPVRRELVGSPATANESVGSTRAEHARAIAVLRVQIAMKDKAKAKGTLPPPYTADTQPPPGNIQPKVPGLRLPAALVAGRTPTGGSVAGPRRFSLANRVRKVSPGHALAAGDKRRVSLGKSRVSVGDQIEQVANTVERKLDRLDVATRNARTAAVTRIARHTRGHLQRRMDARVKAMHAADAEAVEAAKTTEHRLTKFVRQIGIAMTTEHTLLALWWADGTTSLRVEHVQILFNTLALQIVICCLFYSEAPDDGDVHLLQVVIYAAITAGISAPALAAFKLAFALTRAEQPLILDKFFKGLKVLSTLRSPSPRKRAGGNWVNVQRAQNSGVGIRSSEDGRPVPLWKAALALRRRENGGTPRTPRTPRSFPRLSSPSRRQRANTMSPTRRQHGLTPVTPVTPPADNPLSPRIEEGASPLGLFRSPSRRYAQAGTLHADVHITPMRWHSSPAAASPRPLPPPEAEAAFTMADLPPPPPVSVADAAPAKDMLLLSLPVSPHTSSENSPSPSRARVLPNFGKGADEESLWVNRTRVPPLAPRTGPPIRKRSPLEPGLRTRVIAPQYAASSDNTSEGSSEDEGEKRRDKLEGKLWFDDFDASHPAPSPPPSPPAGQPPNKDGSRGWRSRPTPLEEAKPGTPARGVMWPPDVTCESIEGSPIAGHPPNKDGSPGRRPRPTPLEDVKPGVSVRASLKGGPRPLPIETRTPERKVNYSSSVRDSSSPVATPHVPLSARARRTEEERIVANLHKLLAELDVDDSGSLDLFELGVLLERLGEEVDVRQLAAIFRRLDQDGSGKASFDEIEKWFREHKKAESVRLRRAEFWRRYTPSRRTKRVLAWVAMLGLYGTFLLLIVVYGRQFANAKLSRLVSSWSIALSQTFAVEEPIMIVVAQLIPAVMEAISENEVWGAVVHEIFNSFFARAIASCLGSMRGLFIGGNAN
mmetsp:Transcript_30791/g.71714  ORF Transcript_30791/g.71714 Transcript_30791/m.71714 type:complete len:2142 (+) Transcript_30791:407-6832(+)